MATDNSPSTDLVTYEPQAPGRLTRARHHVQAWLQERWWDLEIWAQYTAGPWIGRRFDEVQDALEEGWSGAVGWIRALAYLLFGLVTLTLIGWAVRLTVGLGTSAAAAVAHSAVLTTVGNPVHAYLAAHAAGLPVTPATVWTLWQITGPVLLLAALTRSLIGRLAWCGYGAATAAAVWMAAPDPGRPVALAITVTAWALASILALAGMQLRPVIVINIHRLRLSGRPARSIRAALPAAPVPPADQDPDPGLR